MILFYSITILFVSFPDNSPVPILGEERRCEYILCLIQELDPSGDSVLAK